MVRTIRHRQRDSFALLSRLVVCHLSTRSDKNKNDNVFGVATQGGTAPYGVVFELSHPPK
jgi:hypothetical protein